MRLPSFRNQPQMKGSAVDGNLGTLLGRGLFWNLRCQRRLLCWLLLLLLLLRGAELPAPPSPQNKEKTTKTKNKTCNTSRSHLSPCQTASCSRSIFASKPPTSDPPPSHRACSFRWLQRPMPAIVTMKPMTWRSAHGPWFSTGVFRPAKNPGTPREWARTPHSIPRAGMGATATARLLLTDGVPKDRRAAGHDGDVLQQPDQHKGQR